MLLTTIFNLLTYKNVERYKGDGTWRKFECVERDVARKMLTNIFLQLSWVKTIDFFQNLN